MYRFGISPFIHLLYLSAHGIFLFLFPWKETTEEEKISLTFLLGSQIFHVLIGIAEKSSFSQAEGLLCLK